MSLAVVPGDAASSGASAKEKWCPRVTQKEVTEPPFRNEYWDNHTVRIYLDAVSMETQARFVATDGMQRGTGNRGRACGQLTLHGVTRPLCLDVVFNKAGRYPLPPFRRTIGFSATATLKRSDYGMTSWQSLVGDDIDLRIEAELFRSDADAPAPTQPAPVAGDPAPPPND